MNRTIEILAVVLNLLYTVLYLNGNVWCYLFGILGPAMLLVLCLRNKLYAEPVLQLIYIVFAIYGWLGAAGEWRMVHWPFSKHIPLLLVSAVVAYIAGTILKKRTKANLPYQDSVVTVFGIAGTWLMVNYVHENWLYFIAINAVSIFIYMNRKLYIGAAMFILYFAMAVDGYFQLHIFYA